MKKGHGETPRAKPNATPRAHGAHGGTHGAPSRRAAQSSRDHGAKAKGREGKQHNDYAPKGLDLRSFNRPDAASPAQPLVSEKTKLIQRAEAAERALSETLETTAEQARARGGEAGGGEAAARRACAPHARTRRARRPPTHDARALRRAAAAARAPNCAALN